MNKCEHCLIKDKNALKMLTYEELECFSRHKSTILVKKGENLMVEGNPVNGFYCVKNGKFKLTKLNSNGKDQIISYIKEGYIVGHRSLLCDEPAGLTVTAIEDSFACFVPKDDLLCSIKENPAFALELLKNISHQLNEANCSIANMAQKTVKQRLAETLLFLDDLFGVDKNEYIDVMLTREEIANTLGTATESVIRLLSGFKSNNLIKLKGKKILILDKQALKNISEGY
ncbi:MAG TPA: Crp/Fnr family transcriptional regulator [Flavobacteriaceae bacterium]|nr:Crp/Fnr family transcriptional regulator [Flavobacteriaceae bacterium]HEX5742736.1 Crp/Fnr family transcriptional regulator [Flavobacteriaceae bacterium]